MLEEDVGGGYWIEDVEGGYWRRMLGRMFDEIC
jgi:hypothetical protein